MSWTLADGGRWGIYRDDPAVRYIERFSNRMAELRGNVGQCPAGINTTPLVLPQPKCKLGFEGPDCTDLNECVRGNSLCDRNAACINTEGGFTCQCYEGYIGNGKKCVPNLVALARTRESYYTNNTLSCFAGVVPVAYPVGAPGWVYDPTGYYNNPALINKNRIAVTLNECKMACSTANSCTSFYYDTAYSTCLLYTNSCPYTDSSVPGCAGPCDTNPCGSPLVESCTYPDYSNTPPAEPTLITNPNCGVGVTYFLKGAPLPAGCGPNPVR